MITKELKIDYNSPGRQLDIVWLYSTLKWVQLKQLYFKTQGFDTPVKYLYEGVV